MTPEIQERIAQIRRGEVPEGYKMVGRHLVPVEWNESRMGDIYTERKEPGEESLPILTVSIHSGVSDGALDEDEIGKAVKRIEDKSQYKKAVSGDLVFNMMRAWQGAVGTVRTTGMVSPAYIVAQPNESVDPIFMDYYLKTPLMIYTMHSQSYGVTDFRLRLYWDSFSPIKCALPPIAEQQHIAAILTAQDKLIELKERLLEEKKQQKKYLMQQLLTGKKRLPGFSLPIAEARLKHISSYSSSALVQSEVENYVGKQLYPVYNANTIIGYIDYYEHEYQYISIIKDGAGVGRVRLCSGKSSTIGTLGCIQARDNVNIIFLYYLLEQMDFSKYSNGSTIPHVYYRDYGREKILFPDLDEQAAIATVLSTADREINLLQQSIDAEKQKKKALLQLLLTGVVRVNV